MQRVNLAVGGLYRAKVSGNIVIVRLERIEARPGYNSSRSSYKAKGGTNYHCTNLKTGRQVVFKSAAKFRGPVTGLSAEAALCGLTDLQRKYVSKGEQHTDGTDGGGPCARCLDGHGKPRPPLTRAYCDACYAAGRDAPVGAAFPEENQL